MYQIDQPTAAAVLPTPGALGAQGYFTPGNPGTGVPATVVDADFMNMLMMEIMNVVTAGGQTASKTTYNQLLLAIENLIEVRAGNYALDTGTANAYVVALSPAVTSYTNGMVVRVRTANANTGASTLNAGAGAVGLVNDVEGALQPGDISAGSVFAAVYDSALNKFIMTAVVPSQMLTQAVTDARYASSNFSIAATVATNALTGTLSPCKLDFRSATLTSGASASASIASSLSLVVPSGATLGTVNGVSARLVWLVAYNGGTPVLCVANLAGGLNLDETTLISPTTISAGATAANVIYSASAVSPNSPFRVVGFCDIAEATAGAWATAPTTVQGEGGQALAALSSLGYGQTWQQFTVGSARVLGTTYYNTTGKPIAISFQSANGVSTGCSITVSGLLIANYQSDTTNGNSNSTLFAVIPPGASYSVSSTRSTNNWFELR